MDRETRACTAQGGPIISGSRSPNACWLGLAENSTRMTSPMTPADSDVGSETDSGLGDMRAGPGRPPGWGVGDRIIPWCSEREGGGGGEGKCERVMGEK
jgi:hypothetical protein